MYLNDYGPYVEVLPNGTKNYYLHGQRHRKDGPATEWADGSKYYYLHGELHRVDGPAVEYPSGNKSYYLHGKYYSKELWAQAVKELS